MAAFRQVIADLQAVFPAAELACGPCGKVVGETKKNLRPERLEEGPPAVARKRGTQRADTLGRDDRNALGLPREAEKFFVSGRIAFADRSEMLVFVAEKENLAKIPVFVRFNLWDAIQDGALEIELHHHT